MAEQDSGPPVGPTGASYREITPAAVIFTLPARFLLGIQLDLVCAIAATTAGAGPRHEELIAYL